MEWICQPAIPTALASPATAAYGRTAVEGDSGEVEAVDAAGADEEAAGIDVDSVAASTVAMGDGDGGVNDAATQQM